MLMIKGLCLVYPHICLRKQGAEAQSVTAGHGAFHPHIYIQSHEVQDFKVTSHVKSQALYSHIKSQTLCFSFGGGATALLLG